MQKRRNEEENVYVCMSCIIKHYISGNNNETEVIGYIYFRSATGYFVFQTTGINKEALPKMLLSKPHFTQTPKVLEVETRPHHPTHGDVNSTHLKSAHWYLMLSPT